MAFRAGVMAVCGLCVLSALPAMKFALQSDHIDHSEATVWVSFKNNTDIDWQITLDIKKPEDHKKGTKKRVMVLKAGSDTSIGAPIDQYEQFQEYNIDGDNCKYRTAYGGVMDKNADYDADEPLQPHKGVCKVLTGPILLPKNKVLYFFKTLEPSGAGVPGVCSSGCEPPRSKFHIDMAAPGSFSLEQTGHYVVNGKVDGDYETPVLRKQVRLVNKMPGNSMLEWKDADGETQQYLAPAMGSVNTTFNQTLDTDVYVRTQATFPAEVFENLNVAPWDTDKSTAPYSGTYTVLPLNNANLLASSESASNDGEQTCTDYGNDPWQTGSEVECCGGNQKCLGDYDGTGNYRYVCAPSCGEATASFEQGLWDSTLCEKLQLEQQLGMEIIKYCDITASTAEGRCGC